MTERKPYYMFPEFMAEQAKKAEVPPMCGKMELLEQWAIRDVAESVKRHVISIPSNQTNIRPCRVCAAPILSGQLCDTHHELWLDTYRDDFAGWCTEQQCKRSHERNE